MPQTSLTVVRASTHTWTGSVSSFTVTGQQVGKAASQTQSGALREQTVGMAPSRPWRRQISFP